jgi:hypothetical protein
MLHDRFISPSRKETVVEFVDPPPTIKGERSRKWQEKVDAMKAKRGEWANVGNYSPGVATHIRNGKYKAFLDPENMPASDSEALTYMRVHWEITTRKTDAHSRDDIFIRWLG